MNPKKKNKQAELDKAYKDWKRKSSDVKEFMARKAEFKSIKDKELFVKALLNLNKRKLEAFEKFTTLNMVVKHSE